MTKKTFLFCLILICSGRFLHAQSFQDCSNAFPVCDFKTFHFGQMKGTGLITETPPALTCFNHAFKETNSLWLKWKAANTSTITFVINPNEESNDIDFVLFRRDKENCSILHEVRCMAAGENLDENNPGLNAKCKGRTGLSFTSIDEFENAGCKYSSDNFLKMLHMEKAEEYVLIVNNYNSADGFSITFEGDGNLSKYDECEKITTSEPLLILNLYPNPAVSSINLEYIAQKTESMAIELLDLAGKKHQVFEVYPEIGKNRHSFYLSDLPQGSYLLSIKQGKFTTVRQFIKQ